MVSPDSGRTLRVRDDRALDILWREVDPPPGPEQIDGAIDVALHSAHDGDPYTRHNLGGALHLAPTRNCPRMSTPGSGAWPPMPSFCPRS